MLNQIMLSHVFLCFIAAIGRFPKSCHIVVFAQSMYMITELPSNTSYRRFQLSLAHDNYPTPMHKETDLRDHVLHVNQLFCSEARSS